MKTKLEKMLLYWDLMEQSKWKETNIKESVYYNVFNKSFEQLSDLKFQKKVTLRLLNRINNLKLEL